MVSPTKLLSLAVVVLTPIPTASAAFIGITLEWISGPLVGQTDDMTLEVTSLPGIGDAIIYSPENGNLIDLDLSIPPNNFDEMDDVDGGADSTFPYFSLQRTGPTTGNNQGRVDAVLETITGRFDLLVIDTLVGGPTSDESDYFCRYNESPAFATDPSAPLQDYDPSYCIVTAVSMSETINDLTFGGPSPSQDMIARMIRLSDAAGPVVYRDLQPPIVAVAEPTSFGVLGLGLVGLGAALSRRRGIL
ncbi:MAG: hypothetical protein AAF562_04090 [Pseudomonadota bacterium]